MSENERTLAVDLDGSLIKTDLLWESLLLLIKSNPLNIFLAIIWLMKGKAGFKRQIANRVDINAAILPYNEQVLDYLKEEKSKGRQLVLATASDSKYAEAVSSHLGIFDAHFASDGVTNLSSERKSALLVKTYGEKNFDYIGNSKDDLNVWHHAEGVIIVDGPSGIKRALKNRQYKSIDRERNALLVALRTVRAHQWAKNVLVYVPLISSHQFLQGELFLKTTVMFLTLCLAASAGYIINDLLDLESDRQHHSKCKRPLASSEMTIPVGLILCISLLAISLSFGFATDPVIGLLVIGYLIGTFSYSLLLKKKSIVDVLTLAGLYTYRIIAGGVATDIELSFWLVLLSIFTFLSLAFIKRYSEILKTSNSKDIKGRGYYKDDSTILGIFSAASGYQSVMVLALYLNSDTISTLYSKPQLLWLACPIYIYWITRMLIVTARNEMTDDPLIFALKDRNCLIAIAVLLGLMFYAI